jgi:hypothetical protein
MDGEDEGYDGPEFHGPINWRRDGKGTIDWHPEHWMIQRLAARHKINPYDAAAMGPFLERATSAGLFIMIWRKSPWLALSLAIRHPILFAQSAGTAWRVFHHGR